ncbi:hypothetical protein PV10_00327 [Exophiala mesophila]|uniref:Zn(2)-C6 fungal-type domain-containing protein n=1 Tax=Exophiala mesophila TaxID=212818 RepID=A0A0D1ZPE1_EXOME|nr:uncharacterized protein PV10_00327 [Exophiala mesophila]KIV96457.1 hypothetical protein PV10_00327 [Exophiala mesophila]
MSSALRSKEGCWTCRLRRKKCDERHPQCQTCESLAITCYGFGLKPDWMSDREKEREISSSLKEIVKHRSKRKRIIQRDSSVTIAPKVLSITSKASSSSSTSATLPAQTTRTPILDESDTGQEPVQNPPQLGNVDSSAIEARPCIPPDESSHLMHYLDHVFPLQFPMYKPEGQLGGRGWLLSIILNNVPLYHATLALGAYHQRATIPVHTSHRTYRAATLVQQEQHLEICIKAFNQFASNHCPKSALGINTAVVQLIFFELFTGHGKSWKAHLTAGINMYHRGSTDDVTRFPLSEPSTTILHQDLPLTVYDPVVAEEIESFRFLRSTLVWLDIVSSITAGTAPRLAPHAFCPITNNSQTRIEHVMGCKNWVMLLLGRIAALHQHQCQARLAGIFDTAQFAQEFSDIDTEMQCGLFKEASGFREVAGTPCHAITDPISFVTYLFARAASIYLHLVKHGFDHLELVSPTVGSTLELIQSNTPSDLLPNLILPFFIVASVAAPPDQQFHRDLFSSPPLLDPVRQHRQTILPCLEEIWERRQSAPKFEWEHAVELACDIILV